MKSASGLQVSDRRQVHLDVAQFASSAHNGLFNGLIWPKAG